MKTICWLVVTVLVVGGTLRAETVKDREGAVRADKAKLEAGTRWNYDDVEGGFALAAKSGKPLLVVLRCIPCLACMGIDTSVLEEAGLAPLLDQFVCVRVINANSLDLARFQFDFDLSFSAILFNGDGTVYGRYGSWQHQKDPVNKSTAGFRKTLEAGLELHRDYPANKSSLAGKQGTPVPYRTPIEFPALAGKYQSKLNWDGKVVQSCVHCHMIGDAFRASYRSRDQAVPLEWIYPQPSPVVLGLNLAADATAHVESVLPGSPAAKAGFRSGDDLLMLDGQPIGSIADASWSLHRAADGGVIPAKIRRSGQEEELRVELAPGWRSQSDISRRAGTWPMRSMAFGGLKLEDLTDVERGELGFAGDKMALRIQHVGEYGPHAAAKKEGFKAQDILTTVAGLNQRMSESALIGYLLQKHRPGEKLPVTVRRGTERIALKLPQQ